MVVHDCDDVIEVTICFVISDHGPLIAEDLASAHCAKDVWDSAPENMAYMHVLVVKLYKMALRFTYFLKDGFHNC